MPFLNRFTSGFHQNCLLFKGYKVSYNRNCSTLPVQFRNSQPKPLKLGRRLRPFLGRRLGTRLTQTRLGWGLPPYRVASWCIQPFGHSRNGRKIARGLRPLCWWGRTGSPSNTKSPGLRPTSIISFKQKKLFKVGVWQPVPSSCLNCLPMLKSCSIGAEEVIGVMKCMTADFTNGYFCNIPK